MRHLLVLYSFQDAVLDEVLGIGHLRMEQLIDQALLCRIMTQPCLDTKHSIAHFRPTRLSNDLGGAEEMRQLSHCTWHSNTVYCAVTLLLRAHGRVFAVILACTSCAPAGAHRSSLCIFVLIDDGLRSIAPNNVKLPLWDNMQEVEQVASTYKARLPSTELKGEACAGCCTMHSVR